jgi:predicted DCC family thiol-disulfide oxidoreductase YuxK
MVSTRWLISLTGILVSRPIRSSSFATTTALFVKSTAPKAFSTATTTTTTTPTTLLQSLSSTSQEPSKNQMQQQQQQQQLLLCDDPQIVSQRVFETDQRPIILFDGVCNLCNGAVNLALDWDPQGKFRFAALQSNVGRALLQANGRENTDISSIVLVTSHRRQQQGSGGRGSGGGGGAFIKSDAVLKIAEELTPLGRFLPLLKPLGVVGRYAVPKFLRDLIYDGVADNRYELLGKQDQCRFDADGEFEDRFVDDSLAMKKQQ